jgi:hypothetical protein
MNMRTLVILLIAGVGVGAVAPVLAQQAMSGAAAPASSPHGAMRHDATAPASMQPAMSMQDHPSAMQRGATKSGAMKSDAMKNDAMKSGAMQRPAMRMAPAKTDATTGGN